MPVTLRTFGRTARLARFTKGEQIQVPEISRFFGIIIRMFSEPRTQHRRPHFHAYYQGQVAVCAVDAIEILAGQLPRRQQRLVEAWAELHQEELLADWDRLQSGRPPLKIDPLR